MNNVSKNNKAKKYLVIIFKFHQNFEFASLHRQVEFFRFILIID